MGTHDISLLSLVIYTNIIDTIKYENHQDCNYYNIILVNDIMLIVNNRLIPDIDIKCIQGNQNIGIKPSFKVHQVSLASFLVL